MLSLITFVLIMCFRSPFPGTFLRQSCPGTVSHCIHCCPGTDPMGSFPFQEPSRRKSQTFSEQKKISNYSTWTTTAREMVHRFQDGHRFQSSGNTVSYRKQDLHQETVSYRNFISKLNSIFQQKRAHVVFMISMLVNMSRTS